MSQQKNKTLKTNYIFDYEKNSTFDVLLSLEYFYENKYVAKSIDKFFLDKL